MNGGKGPCGACKFLRRKCTKGCVFAPYFDRDHESARFAAVHKVFGASNASKILQRVPPNKRLDAVATLYYEAMARIRDPIYGCLANLLTLQQQRLATLRAELAYLQARLSIMQRTSIFPLPESVTWIENLPTTSFDESHTPAAFRKHQQQMSTMELINDTSLYLLESEEAAAEEDDLHALAREFVSKHSAGVVKLRPPN